MSSHSFPFGIIDIGPHQSDDSNQMRPTPRPSGSQTKSANRHRRKSITTLHEFKIERISSYVSRSEVTL